MKPRLLFVHNYSTKFVQIDLALLREMYDVREWHQQGRRVNAVELARAVDGSDLVFGWFASWHTFLPLLMARARRRPSVLVVGGYDSANLPGIGYGHQRGGMRRRVSRATMRLATRLIANSHFAGDEVIRNGGVDPERLSVIYHGLEVDGQYAAAAKDETIVTAGKVDRENLQRKGLEPFVRAAACLPEHRFVVIGAWFDDAIEHLRLLSTPNVHFTNWLPENELYGYFSRARVYVQASQHEAFGMSLAEAMLCECVPVVTRVGAIPEVVGSTGIYLDSPSPEAIEQGIRAALSSKAEYGRLARERIAREFPLGCRREGLYRVVEEALATYG